MKSFFKYCAGILLVVLSCTDLSAQEVNNNPDNNTVQMAVMIVPFRKNGQDYRALYDESKGVQLAIDRLKEGFDSKGFQVKDFVSTYDNEITDQEIAKISSQDDVLSMIARKSNTDILITVDVLPVMRTESGSSVTVRINAVDASTNYAYGTQVCVSPTFNTLDTLVLISRAISKNANEMQISTALATFLDKLQASFTSVLAKGRPLKVVFGLGKDSMLDFYSKVAKAENQVLSVMINNWVKTAAYKNYSQMGSSGKLSVIYNDIRVPVKDENGLNYSPFDFGVKISEFLSSKGLKVDPPYMRAGALYVTIN